MSLLDTVAQLADRVSRPRVAHAHCDVPCGIYDATPARLAANTVLTLTQKIEALAPPAMDSGDKQALLTFANTLDRMVMVKEQHAELCKRELLILWTDWFKPPHLERWPDLHTKVWNACKLASKCKQEVNLQACQDLAAAVNEIADIFSQSGYSMPNPQVMAGH